VNDEAPVGIRRVRDLESFLDRMAVLELLTEIQAPPLKTDPIGRTRRNVITFAPEGIRVSLPTSMENKRPQLNLDELHQLRWLLGRVLTLISGGPCFISRSTRGC